MANQETSLYEGQLAGKRANRLLVAAAVIVLLAFAVFAVASFDGRPEPVISGQSAIEQPAAPAPASLDRHEAARGSNTATKGEAAGTDEQEIENQYPRVSATPWEYYHGR